MRHRGMIGGLVAALAVVALPAGTGASSFTMTVNSLADTVAVDGQCTLREAIQNHNTHSKVNPDCPKGGGSDKIGFSVSGTITLALGELPAVEGKLMINGLEAVTVDGNAASRIIETADGATLTLISIALTNGSTGGDGGAILNPNAKVQLSDVVISNSTAGGSGGGLYSPGGGKVTINGSTFSGNSAANAGALGGVGITIADSSFTGNHASGYGGAIYTCFSSMSDSTVSNNTAGAGFGGLAFCNSGFLRRVTISDNSAPSFGGGGIQISGDTQFLVDQVTVSDNTASCWGGGFVTYFADSQPTILIQNSTINDNQITSACSLGGGGFATQGVGNLTIANSTITDNYSAATTGGGIWNNGSVALVNDTITANSVGVGTGTGGIYDNGGATTTLANTIVADNNNGDADTDCAGPGITSLGSNIDSDGTCGLGAAGDLSSTEPILGPLQNNGGATQTMEPDSSSPAVDAGNDKACKAKPISGKDQRGVKRPQGKHCDIGAVELVPTRR